MNESINHFKYSGRLIFNGIYRTEIAEDDFDIGTISDRLPTFREGVPEEPGYGYTVKELEDFTYPNDPITKQFEQEIENTVLIRFRYEEYSTEQAIVDGDIREVTTRTTNEVEAYWLFPEYLYVRGSKTETKRTTTEIKRALGAGIRLEKIEFDFRFLLWIFYKHYEDERLDSELSTYRLSDAETRDREGAPAEIKRFTDARDVTRSESVLRDLMRILRGKTLTMIGGVFRLGDYEYAASISTEGRIQIKSQHDISQATDIQRIILSLVFLRKITHLYSVWQTRSPEDQYPPQEFFQDIADFLTKRGMDVEFSLDETLIPYYKETQEE